MARLPVLRKRRSKAQQALDLAKGAAKVWTTVKVSSVGARAAKKGAKAYGAVKGARFVGRRAGKIAIVPVAVGGGVLVWRKVKPSGAGAGAGEHEHERPLGPVATAESVSPPSTDGEMADEPAGAGHA